MSEYYTRVFNLQDHVDDASDVDVKNEFDLIQAAFALLPTLAGNAGKYVVVNATETALEAVTPTTATASIGASSSISIPTDTDDFIIQFTTGTANGTGDATITLPLTFPNAILAAFVCANDSAGWATNTYYTWGVEFTSCTTSTVVADCRKQVGTAAPTNSVSGATCFCIAVGY